MLELLINNLKINIIGSQEKTNHLKVNKKNLLKSSEKKTDNNKHKQMRNISRGIDVIKK